MNLLKQTFTLKNSGIKCEKYEEIFIIFIINKNNATSSDILDLIDYVRDEVLEKTGVMLETEIIYVE